MVILVTVDRGYHSNLGLSSVQVSLSVWHQLILSMVRIASRMKSVNRLVLLLLVCLMLMLYSCYSIVYKMSDCVSVINDF